MCSNVGCFIHLLNVLNNLGGRHGLVVMGDGSCSRGRGFESWRRLLDGHFFTFIFCKN